MSLSPSSSPVASGTSAAAALTVLSLLGLLGACRRSPQTADRPSVASAVAQTSAACRECHREIHAAWAPTDHANANRPVVPARDAEALRLFAAAAPAAPAPDFILGQKPSWQPLVPFPGGRWQPHEQAYDPARREFFNVFGDEGRRPGEWGHWTGRGMNWNSRCAHCHMTGFQRRYDGAADGYRSSWVEHGVGCIQCHGPMPAGHGDKRRPPPPGPKPPFYGDRRRMMQTCAPCHARNELLTERFQPGDNYHDHYRITLPVDAAAFHPDGQQRDEDFNWTSVLLSRMGHAGVTCLDCHDPHTAKTVLPAADNRLCQQCHAAPGRKLPGGKTAVAIDPLAHSRHQPGSAGHSCIACHMPTTTYMQRSPRHDHGWLSPDPLLTKELGIPNACSNCHADKGLDWTMAKADEWFGTEVRSRQRGRARAIAAAQAGAPGAAGALVALLAAEDIPAWRATYLALLPQTGEPEKGRPAALAALRAADPLERAAAARFFAGAADAGTHLPPLLADPVRLVRLDAAWALSPTLAPDSAARRELDEYLALSLDQPAGRVRLAQDLANRGRLDAALAEMARALDWEPNSAGILETRAAMLASAGRLAGAGADYHRAAELAERGAGALAMQAGLAFAEAGRFAEAEHSLRLGQRKEPAFHRASYNLGLLLARQERLTEAAGALRAAERHGPQVADYPYALATVLARLGDRAAARAAVDRALALDPAHREARHFRDALR